MAAGSGFPQLCAAVMSHPHGEQHLRRPAATGQRVWCRATAWLAGKQRHCAHNSRLRREIAEHLRQFPDYFGEYFEGFVTSRRTWSVSVRVVG